MKRIIQIISLAILTIFLNFGIGHAADFLVPNQTNNNDSSIVQSKEVNDNLFVVGDDIKINAPVNGDLIGMGNKITINAPVSGNIFFAGNTVIINTQVKHDVFIGANQLALGKGSLISGSLYASSQKTANINQSTVMGKRILAKYNHNPSHQINPFLATISFLTMLITGLILLKLFPNTTTNVVKIVKKDWGKSLLVGVISLILVPIVSALLIISIIGIPFALALLIFFALALYLGLIIVSYLIGYLIFKDRINKYLVFTFGLILLKLVNSVTVIGIITPILSIFGLGLFINIKLKAYHLIKDKI